MKNETEQPWLEAGYEIFSKDGPAGLKVEHIARKVGISKSSFYHLFVDVEIFQEKLLEYHLKRAKEMSDQSEGCKEIVPDILNLFLENKIPLLFNRQLCIHRNSQLFQSYSEKATAIVEHTYFEKWVDLLGLQTQKHIAKNILKIYTDNFFLRISEETLTYEWLLSLLEEIKILVKDIKKQ
jgi:AcrR family transcriptional regulator